MKRPSERSHLVAEPEDVFCRTKRQTIALHYSVPGRLDGADSMHRFGRGVSEICAWGGYSVKSIHSESHFVEIEGPAAKCRKKSGAQ